MLYKECYAELKKAMLRLYKKKAFEKFTYMNFFYLIDEKSHGIAVFNSLTSGNLPSLSFYLKDVGIQYLFDSYLSSTGLVHNGVFANMLVLSLVPRSDLTEEDIAFFKKKKIRITQENNLLPCEFKEGYMYQYFSLSKIKQVVEYLYYLNSLLDNELKDIEEAFQKEEIVLAGFDTVNHLYELKFTKDFSLGRMPAYKKIDFNFANEYKESTYVDDTCYIGRYFEPMKEDGQPYYDALLVAYYEKKDTHIVQKISCKPHQFLEYCYGFLDMVFKKEGLPTKIVFNNRRLTSLLLKTLAYLDIEVVYHREPEQLDTIFLEYVQEILDETEEGEKRRTSLCHNMKKILFLFLMLGSLTACGLGADPSTENIIPIEILEMNDIHGHIENEGDYGGLARASSLISDIRQETKEDNTILIGNGDMLQETAISRVSYGKVVIDAMSQMQFDFMGVGNHEFDWGFDRFLSYFDGNEENGEASFPLVNSNIYYENALVEDEKVVSKLLLQKENVKVGVVSYIGNLYSSINANMTEGYTFKGRSQEIADSVASLGRALKEEGADIILVNIHDGEVSSCIEYQANLLLAQLKYQEKYLVDAVINGHTHMNQDALIQRTGGVSLPVVQSSGKLADFGRIDLSYDLDAREVTSAKISHIDVTSTKKEDSKVTKIIENHYFAAKNILEEVYCQNQQYISRYDSHFQAYALNVMMAGTNATAACCNTGAFRNNVGVGSFDFKKLYALNPFDNHIILCEISGIDLKRFYDANSNYEIVYTKNYGPFIATDQTYTLAIVDYVYFSNYFAAYRTDSFIDTQLIVRDLIAEDLRLRKDTGFTISSDYLDPLISSFL